MTYTAVTFTISPHSEAAADVLIDMLCSAGYEGFEYTAEGFSAYIPSADFDGHYLNRLEIPAWITETFSLSWSIQEIPDKNWNKEWEEHFTPVTIEKRVMIRAGFHAPNPEVEHDIIIEPKMSFGTGHHPTTALMIRSILAHADRIRDRKVLDMGCGTGILSIMAVKAGARSVVGIDIDEWAFHNAMENMGNNGIECVNIKIGDAQLLKEEEKVAVVLANINRNILLEDMGAYDDVLQPGGIMAMSGFYEKDLPLIREKAGTLGLRYCSHLSDQEWCAAIFTKQEDVV